MAASWSSVSGNERTCRFNWTVVARGGSIPSAHRNFNYCFGDWTRNRFAMLFQTFEIPLNSVGNVCHCFIACFALRNAAGQRWALCDENSILVRFDGNAKFQAASLPSEH